MMFEKTKRDEKRFQGFQSEKKAYADGTYDCTFDKRYIIYHYFRAGNYTYIALDKRTGYGSQITITPHAVGLDRMKYLTPSILFSIKYTGDVRYLGPPSMYPEKFIDLVFRKIMPRYGFAVREEQIRLSKRMYEGLSSKRVTLCEAEVGTGKTMAYLVAGLALKLCNRTRDNEMMPVTISTSSIELQQAIITKEIPMLTKMMNESGMMARPIRAVVRKGKSHYFCLARHMDYYDSIKKYPDKYSETLSLLNDLCLPLNALDLDMQPKLKGYLKAKICVKGSCFKCPQAAVCAYQDFIQRTRAEKYDFQITNHNLLLVSQLRRHRDGSELLRQSPYCIIDEAHKLLDAAESVFGAEFDQSMIPDYLDSVKNTCQGTPSRDAYNALIQYAHSVHNSMIRSLWRARDKSCSDDDNGRYALQMTPKSVELLREMVDVLGKIEGYRQNKVHQCGYLLETLKRYADHPDALFWVTAEKTEDHGLFLSFTCLPRSLSEEVYKHLWKQSGSHYCLTSGTMCDDAGFDFFKDENGINSNISPYSISETTCESPFDYRNHTRMYISERVSYPDNDSAQYINEVADEIERLIRATCGHTAILFTSYKVLAEVYEKLKTRITEYPLICMTKSNRNAIQEFKAGKNSVLFASGSMWEGVDCAGDTLSSVIIVRLPFPLRTEALEQKKANCETLDDFVQRYAVPQMIIKLRQGAGRLIRNETDTGVISILDSRAAPAGSHRQRVLKAMDKYPLVDSVEEIESFIRQVKSADYFDNHETDCFD